MCTHGLCESLREGVSADYFDIGMVVVPMSFLLQGWSSIMRLGPAGSILLTTSVSSPHRRPTAHTTARCPAELSKVVTPFACSRYQCGCVMLINRILKQLCGSFHAVAFALPMQC